MNESAINKAAPKETLTPIPLGSSFMFHKDFYPKPRIMLFDAVLSNESKQQLNEPLEELSDIMSKNSTDISAMTYSFDYHCGYDTELLLWK